MNTDKKSEQEQTEGTEKGKKIEIEFSIGSKILVKEIQRPGRVEALMVDGLGLQCRVAYWDNAERKSVWLYGDEIEARK